MHFFCFHPGWLCLLTTKRPAFQNGRRVTGIVCVLVGLFNARITPITVAKTVLQVPKRSAQLYRDLRQHRPAVPHSLGQSEDNGVVVFLKTITTVYYHLVYIHPFGLLPIWSTTVCPQIPMSPTYYVLYTYTVHSFLGHFPSVVWNWCQCCCRPYYLLNCYISRVGQYNCFWPAVYAINISMRVYYMSKLDRLI